MNFDFTEEQELLRKTVRGFVDKEIMPYIGEWDAKGQFNPDIIKTRSSWINGRLYTGKIRWKWYGL